MNTPLNSLDSTNKMSCLCSPDGTAQSKPSSGATRRGFLSSLLATGTATGLGATLAGCQSIEGIFTATPAKSPRIDIHHHMVPPSYAADMKRMGIGSPRWTPQMSIDDMDKNDIATSVVALIQPGAFFKNVTADRRMAREANEYAAQMSRDFPGRFGSFATLPLMDVEGSLREITYAYDTLKADGIGLMTSYGDLYLGDKHFWPIWEELNRRKAVIYVHPLQPDCCRNLIPGLPNSSLEYATDTTRTIASMLFSGAANKFPDIRWIWSHSGGTMPFLWSRFTRQVVDMKEKAKEVLPNGVLKEVQKFYYDTAQGHHEGAMQALRQLIPTSQIMYGSDYPYRPGAETRTGLAERQFTQAERVAIDRGNALRLMPQLARKA
ncbi:MAG: amidohydrolase [Comamonadaceae bacterium]|nr:amidohydrolase [Comamonadaceae bacterium]